MAAVFSTSATALLCLLLLTFAGRGLAAGKLEDQRDYQAARQALADGLFDVAAVKAGRLAALDGFNQEESRRLATLWVEALVRAGRGDEALEALKTHPVEHQSFWQGQALLLTGDFDEAATVLADAVETVPEALKAWAVIARAHALTGDERESAARSLIKTLRDHRDPAVARHARQFFNELEATQKPQTVLDRLSREHGEKDAVVQYLRAVALVGLNDTAKSEAVLRDLLATESQGMASLVHDAATVLLAQVLARAHASGERALETITGFLNSFSMSAGARQDTELWGEAFALLEQLAANGKPGELLVRTPVIAWAGDGSLPERQGYAQLFVATELHRTGRNAEATGLVEALLQGQPHHPRTSDAIRLAMQLHGTARDDERVLQLAERWREEFGGGGGRAVVDFLVGLIHFMRGDYGDAMKSFVQASDSESDHWRRRRALYNAAVCAIKTGQKSMFQTLLAQLSKATAEDANARKPGAPPLHDTDADLALDKALQLAAKLDSRAEKELLEFLKNHGTHARAAEAQIALAEFRLLDVPPRVKDATETLARAAQTATTDAQRERIDHVQIWLREAQLDASGVVATAQAFLKAWPNSDRADEVHMKLAESLYRQEKYALARTEFEKLAATYATSEYADSALYFAGMSAMALSTPEGLNAAISTWDDLSQRGGPLAFAARQQQAVATVRQGNREKALKLYDTLLAAPDAKGGQRLSLQMEKAQLLIDLGRKEPKQREAAVALLRQMLATERLSYVWAARCGVLLATTLHDMGKDSEALEACYDVINVGNNIVTAPQNPTEYQWYYRAGFIAVDLLEAAQQWEAAAHVAERLAQTSGDRASDAAARASKIRLKHFLWDGEK